MKLKDIINLINTDSYIICYNDLVEEIRDTDQGSFRAIRKYYELEVDKITPLNNAIEITLK